MHTAGMASNPGPQDDGGPSSPTWQHVDTLEVTQIVLTILEARKTMPWATAATVSRERRGGATYVRVTLLESSPSATADGQEGRGAGEIIAAYAVRRLGDDLANAFGDRDVITLK